MDSMARIEFLRQKRLLALGVIDKFPSPNADELFQQDQDVENPLSSCPPSVDQAPTDEAASDPSGEPVVMGSRPEGSNGKNQHQAAKSSHDAVQSCSNGSNQHQAAGRSHDVGREAVQSCTDSVPGSSGVLSSANTDYIYIQDTDDDEIQAECQPTKTLMVTSGEFAKVGTGSHFDYSEEDDILCSVCMIDLPIGVLVSCHHAYCINCFKRLKKMRKPCPRCKVSFRSWMVIDY